MTTTSDILLNYFDSLLAPTEESQREINNLSCALENINAQPSVSRESASTIFQSGNADTIPRGFRLISLVTPASSKSGAINRTISLELLSISRRLSAGSLKSLVLQACVGALHNV